MQSRRNEFFDGLCRNAPFSFAPEGALAYPWRQRAGAPDGLLMRQSTVSYKVGSHMIHMFSIISSVVSRRALVASPASKLWSLTVT